MRAVSLFLLFILFLSPFYYSPTLTSFLTSFHLAGSLPSSAPSFLLSPSWYTEIPSIYRLLGHAQLGKLGRPRTLICTWNLAACFTSSLHVHVCYRTSGVWFLWESTNNDVRTHAAGWLRTFLSKNSTNNGRTHAVRWLRRFPLESAANHTRALDGGWLPLFLSENKLIIRERAEGCLP